MGDRMNQQVISTWQDLNKSYLMQELARVKQMLTAKIAEMKKSDLSTYTIDRSGDLWEEMPDDFPPTALELIGNRFGLSPFERDILLLCAGMEFESDWAISCGKLQGSMETSYPTFSLALSVLSAVHWDALTPEAPLRRWQLIELRGGNILTQKELVIDEQILHYLAGIQHLDERLRGLVEPVDLDISLPESHQSIVSQLVNTWLENQDTTLPVIHLCGKDAASKKAIALSACQELQLNLYQISVEVLPTDTSQINLFKCLLEREWLLNQTVFLFNCDREMTVENNRQSSLNILIESLNCPLIISSSDRRRQRERPLINYDISEPTTEEQKHFWQESLGTDAIHLGDRVDSLVSYFSLNVPTIKTVCRQLTVQPPSDRANQLWQMCRTHARPYLEELAQRIESNVGWQDLILPPTELDTLKEIAAHVRQRTKVYEQWGFGAKNSRGLGISALFAGASGTGKTLAAEVLGNELNLDVYRIDLSSVVSKYIGETEKNLRRIFDAAEGCGAILLFDEADALFGKRSEVKDSHDRYANMEVSYLLQRIESYRGLAILTTNLKNDLDQAFLRRIRFIVQFSFPDNSQRSEIWSRIFPSQTPTEDLSFSKLAKLNVSGGNIRNIAMNAAFIAADAQEAVQMKHILQAAKSEYTKLERPLTDGEVKDWV